MATTQLTRNGTFKIANLNVMRTAYDTWLVAGKEFETLYEAEDYVRSRGQKARERLDALEMATEEMPADIAAATKPNED